jgi:hypothetical protein
MKNAWAQAANENRWTEEDKSTSRDPALRKTRTRAVAGDRGNENKKGKQEPFSGEESPSLKPR